MNHYLRLASGLLFVLLFAGNSQAGDIWSLKGVKDVYVVVDLDHELREVGMADERMKAWVEQRLRAQGVRVVDAGNQTTTSAVCERADIGTQVRRRLVQLRIECGVMAGRAVDQLGRHCQSPHVVEQHDWILHAKPHRGQTAGGRRPERERVREGPERNQPIGA